MGIFNVLNIKSGKPLKGCLPSGRAKELKILEEIVLTMGFFCDLLDIKRKMTS